MKLDIVQKHIFETYVTMRIGIAALAIMFPSVLVFGGFYIDIPLQDSMSAYYHAMNNNHSMRDFFVGILFAIGVFLYLYKGYRKDEDYVLNLAGAAAIGVALIPMQRDCGDSCASISLHGICAFTLFISVAYVCIWCAPHTLEELKNKVKEQRYRKIYMLLGICMVLSPVIAWLLTFIFKKFHAYTYIAEAVGIVIFAIYWLVKSGELAATKSEHRLIYNAIVKS